MKTVLLTAALSVFALAASAQVSVRDLSKELVKGPVKNAPQMYLAGKSLKDIKITPASAKNLKKAVDQNSVESLYGSYIWFDQESQEEGGVDICSTVKISAADDYVLVDPTTGASETFKQVHMEGLAQGYATVDAIVDADTLVVPTQYCYEHSTYGKMSLCGLYADGENLMISNSIQFVKNEDGNLELYPGYIGWLVYMDDFAEAGNDSPYWNMYWSETGEGAGAMLKANGIQVYNTVKNNKWTEVESEVYVKKSRSSISVYNFVEQSVASMTLSNDGSAKLPTGQPIYATNGQIDEEVYGTSMDIVGVGVTDDGYIHRDYAIEQLVGSWEGNTFVAFMGSEADPGAAYFAVATLPDAEGAAYSLGWFCDYQLLFGEDYYAYKTGINDVNVRPVSKSTKTYNMMGMQVDENAKGMIIKNGKKYLVK